MKLYKIQDREAGNIIEDNLTIEEAELLVEQSEANDKSENCYVPDFYEIKEMEENED